MNPFDQAVDQVLRQPKYGVLTGRMPDLKEAVGRWVVNLITKLLDLLDIPVEMSRMNRYGDIFGVIFVILLALFAVFLSVLVIRIYLRRRRKKRLLVNDIYDGVDATLTFAGLLEKSTAFALEGNMREAVRYRYIALLAVLDDSHILSAHRSKTNNQLLRDIKSSAPNYYHACRQVVDVFHKAWFGQKSITDTGFGEYREQTDYIITEAQRHENQA